MAWTAPMTAVANAVFTAAQFNTHVRDNFLETAPGKATTAGSFFAATAANAIEERLPTSAEIQTNESTTNTTNFVDLTTVGPSVTVTCGVKALVLFRADTVANLQSGVAGISYDLSGANTSAAAFGNGKSAQLEGTFAAADKSTITGLDMLTGLTPGSNTFKMQYRAFTSGANWENRCITVIPF